MKKIALILTLLAGQPIAIAGEHSVHTMPINTMPTNSTPAGHLVAKGSSASSAVMISDAWVRAVPPVSRNTAAYFSLTALENDTLLSVSADVADSVEMHEMQRSASGVSMQALERVNLPAMQPVHFAPGGNHVMLIGLKKPLAKGDSVVLTLKLQKAGIMPVIAKVQEAPAAEKAEAHKHH